MGPSYTLPAMGSTAEAKQMRAVNAQRIFGHSFEISDELLQSVLDTTHSIDDCEIVIELCPSGSPIIEHAWTTMEVLASNHADLLYLEYVAHKKSQLELAGRVLHKALDAVANFEQATDVMHRTIVRDNSLRVAAVAKATWLVQTQPCRVCAVEKIKDVRFDAAFSHNVWQPHSSGRISQEEADRRISDAIERGDIDPADLLVD